MILEKGPRIIVDLNGIQGTIGQTMGGKAFVIVCGPERMPGNPNSRYHPFGAEGLPRDADQSAFARLYRTLDILVGFDEIEGPFGDDRPTYAVFRYFYVGSPAELVAFLENRRIYVKVRRIQHSGDDTEFEQAKKDFSHWIDFDTVFDPNPKIEESRKQKEMQDKFDADMERADRWDRNFKRYALIPVALSLIGVILWLASSLHLSAGIATTALVIWLAWKIWFRH